MAHREVSASPFSRQYNGSDDVDPMSGMANLADIMLVFACGLMLSIVAYFNVDITPDYTEVVESDSMEEVADDIEEAQNSMTSGSGYERRGVVYQDPSTGKMYLLTDEDSTDATSDSEASGDTDGTAVTDSASASASE